MLVPLAAVESSLIDYDASGMRGRGMAEAPSAGSAPQRFVEWMTAHEHVDRKNGLTYRYHPRSDAHSVALCRFIADDLVRMSPALSHALATSLVACGINVPFAGKDGRLKTLDLAFGEDSLGLPAALDLADLVTAKSLLKVILSCEAKSVMTEHSKSQPRVYDELSSSHEIIHQADATALAAGVVIVNISGEFVSPTRQYPGQPVSVTQHRQPRAAANMIAHLRGLPIRPTAETVGFDAFAIIVVECDNVGPARLWTDSPAPQPGEPDHYASFVSRLSLALEIRLAGTGD
jgi:hypothetical protein